MCANLFRCLQRSTHACPAPLQGLAQSVLVALPRQLVVDADFLDAAYSLPVPSFSGTRLRFLRSAA
eukprot:1141931-Pleurochrysis_carterae.AAC.4